MRWVRMRSVLLLFCATLLALPLTFVWRFATCVPGEGSWLGWNGDLQGGGTLVAWRYCISSTLSRSFSSSCLSSLGICRIDSSSSISSWVSPWVFAAFAVFCGVHGADSLSPQMKSAPSSSSLRRSSSILRSNAFFEAIISIPA